MRPQPESSSQEVLAGLVERVTYHNAENGFCVLRAKEVETLDDVRIASSACEHCGSYLVVATDAAQARKKT